MSSVLKPETKSKTGFVLSEIPQNYIPKLTHYNQFLIGGELKKWSGAVTEVYFRPLSRQKMHLIGVRVNGQLCA